jgi:hypothetical protein
MIHQLEQYLGPPTELFEFKKNPLESSAIRDLKIAYFAPRGGTGRVVFATSGAFRCRMNDGRRFEAMMILRKEPTGEAFDAVRDLLSTFVLLPEANGRSLRYGDVVRADLSRFSVMDALMVVPPLPFPDRYHRAKLKRGGAVDFLWLVPLFADKSRYALKFGPSAMMLLAAAQRLDLTDMDRPEANTHAHPSDIISLAKEATTEMLEKARTARSRPKTPAPKLKSSPRNVGKGSFDVKVDQKAGAVRVSRRSSGRDRSLS